MNAFAQFVFEIVLQGVIAQPVTFARWLLSGRKQSYKQFWREADLYSDSGIGMIMLALFFFFAYNCIPACKAKSHKEDMHGFWIVPGDPVVSIVIEKDSVSWPDYKPGVQYPYRIANDMLIVNSEEGVDTIGYKLDGRDTLRLRYYPSDNFVLLVSNK